MRKYKLHQTKRAYLYWKLFPNIPLKSVADQFGISYTTIQKFITQQLLQK